jgi:hypothetical protein
MTKIAVYEQTGCHLRVKKASLLQTGTTGQFKSTDIIGTLLPYISKYSGYKIKQVQIESRITSVPIMFKKGEKHWQNHRPDPTPNQTSYLLP